MSEVATIGEQSETVFFDECKVTVSFTTLKYTLRDSNPRHPTCKAETLPTELKVQKTRNKRIELTLEFPQGTDSNCWARKPLTKVSLFYAIVKIILNL